MSRSANGACLDACNTLFGAEFAEVLASIDKKADVNALRGAARFFFAEDYYQKVTRPVATSWLVRLAEAELDRQSETGGPCNHNRSVIVEVLSRFDLPEVQPLMKELQVGESEGRASSLSEY